MPFPWQGWPVRKHYSHPAEEARSDLEDHSSDIGSPRCHAEAPRRRQEAASHVCALGLDPRARIDGDYAERRQTPRFGCWIFLVALLAGLALAVAIVDSWARSPLDSSAEGALLKAERTDAASSHHLAGSKEREQEEGAKQKPEMAPCWKPVGSGGVVLVAVLQGEGLAELPYNDVKDCMFACDSDARCQSFTECNAWKSCFLKEKMLTDADGLMESLEGCRSWLQVPCADGEDPKSHPQSAGMTAPPPPTAVPLAAADLWSSTVIPGSTASTVTTTSTATPSSIAEMESPADTPESAASSAFAASGDLASVLTSGTAPQMAASSQAATATAEVASSRHAAESKENEQAMLDTRARDRASFVWIPYSGFDMPGGDVGAMDGSDIGAVKRACKDKGCSGFSLREGTAYLKAAREPFTRDQLHYAGGHVIFYTLAPPRKMSWRPLPGCDLLVAGDVDTLQSSEVEHLKRYAEKGGFSGFTVRGASAYMKMTDEPLTKDSLQCSSEDQCTFFLADPVSADTGVRPWDQAHIASHQDCSGAGAADNCMDTRCCADDGYLCFQRDEAFAGCRQTCESNWECRVLGTVRDRKAGMFCFALALAGSQEMALLQQQLLRGEGLAGCDEYMLFSDVAEPLGTGVDTVALAGMSTRDSAAGTGMSTRDSARTYHEAWLQVLDHYIWRVYQWIVKVDPHTFFFPNQLKAGLLAKIGDFLHSEQDHGSYLRTCEEGSCMCSALEVVSQTAMVEFSMNGREKCEALLFSPGIPEDMWFQSCMDALHVRGVSMPVVAGGPCNVSGRDDMAPPECNFGDKAAFFPMRTLADGQHCLRNALGQ